MFFIQNLGRTVFRFNIILLFVLNVLQKDFLLEKISSSLCKKLKFSLIKNWVILSVFGIYFASIFMSNLHNSYLQFKYYLNFEINVLSYSIFLCVINFIFLYFE